MSGDDAMSGRPTILGARRMEWLIGASIVIVDQITKAIVRDTLPLHGSVQVIPGLLNLTHVHNTGAAFGFLNATDFPYKPLVVTLVATVALLGIGYYASRLPLEDQVVRAGFGLVMGGAVGNLIDRATVGYVVDFVDAYWQDLHFWAFNIADSAITVGASLLILDMLRTRHHASNAV